MDDAESIFSNPVFQIAGMFKAAYSDDTPKIPEGLSEEGKDFLRKCLRRDPESRPTAAQLMDHDFVRDYFASVTGAKPAELATEVGSTETTTGSNTYITMLYTGICRFHRALTTSMSTCSFAYASV